MKQPIIYLFLSCGLILGVVMTTHGQSAEQSIRDTFVRYRQMTLDENYEGLMDYVYPQLLELAPREQIIAIYQEPGNREMRIDYTALDINSVSPVFEFDGTQYSMLEVTGNLDIRLTGPDAQDSTFQETVYTIIAASYGSDNIAREPTTSGESVMHVELQKTIYALAPTGTSNWKFLEAGSDAAGFVELIIPEEVRTHFLGG